MPGESEKKTTFFVHTIGGEALTIKASKFRINEKENRVYFEDVDEDKEGQWTFFLSGIAAIRKRPERKISTPSRIL